jgi:tRNA nucleotidyltransferase (CCA-adding enzyme)
MKPLSAQIEKQVIPSVTLERQKSRLVEKIVQLVEKEIAKYPQVVGIELGGSFAKGTWLAHGTDVDIFVRFKTDVPEKEFVDLGKKIGFASLRNYKPYVRYAEHPFVEAAIGDTKVNLVPCYDVKEGKWKSSADRSPFHTRFMTKSLTAQMKNEVRILKWFLKCNGIYGAEIAKQGFSGYVTEVLVLNFGTFEGVLKAVSHLQQGQIIGSAAKQFDSKIVIMDPIDPNRNLGAAISNENLGRFVLLARTFLRNPSSRFFTQKKIKSVPKKKLGNVLVVEFKYRYRSPDIIWGQLKRAATSIATQIDQEGFTVLRKSVLASEGNAALLFFLQSATLSEYRLRVGPDFFVEEHASKFVASNKKKSTSMWINDEGKICSLQKRVQRDAFLFVKELLKKNLKTAGISVGLQDDIKRFRVISGDTITSKSIKEAASELVSTDETVFSSH